MKIKINKSVLKQAVERVLKQANRQMVYEGVLMDKLTAKFGQNAQNIRKFIGQNWKQFQKKKLPYVMGGVAQDPNGHKNQSVGTQDSSKTRYMRKNTAEPGPGVMAQGIEEPTEIANCTEKEQGLVFNHEPDETIKTGYSSDEGATELHIHYINGNTFVETVGERYNAEPYKMIGIHKPEQVLNKYKEQMSDENDRGIQF